MDNTVALVVAIVGAVTGLGGLATSWRTSRASAKRDDVEALRGIIDELREHVEAQAKQIGRLEVEVRAWRRRFERVCQQFGVRPEEQITGGLGALPEPGAQAGGNG